MRTRGQAGIGHLSRDSLPLSGAGIAPVWLALPSEDPSRGIIEAPLMGPVRGPRQGTERRGEMSGPWSSDRAFIVLLYHL